MRWRWEESALLGWKVEALQGGPSDHQNGGGREGHFREAGEQQEQGLQTVGTSWGGRGRVRGWEAGRKNICKRWDRRDAQRPGAQLLDWGILIKHFYAFGHVDIHDLLLDSKAQIIKFSKKNFHQLLCITSIFSPSRSPWHPCCLICPLRHGAPLPTSHCPCLIAASHRPTILLELDPFLKP